MHKPTHTGHCPTPMSSQEIARIQAAIDKCTRESAQHDRSCATEMDYSLRCNCQRSKSAEYECAHCGCDCAGECDAVTRSHFDF